MPSVSVVMCAYNAAEFIALAIQSILDQTLTDFELLIVDDASTDTTRDIIHTFKDPRIRVFYHEKNRGSAAARNTALREAKGEYIALMDADDISLPSRLMRQKRYLDTHKDIGLLGTNSIGLERNRFQPRLCSNLFASLGVDVLIKMEFENPTLMFRSKIFRENHIYYDESFVHGEAEDFEFISRILPHTKVRKMARPLLIYRVRANSQYHGNSLISGRSAAHTATKNLGRVIPIFVRNHPKDTQDFLEFFLSIKEIKNPQEIKRIIITWQGIENALAESLHLRPSLFLRKKLVRKLVHACRSIGHRRLYLYYAIVCNSRSLTAALLYKDIPIIISQPLLKLFYNHISSYRAVLENK